jgi:hypothetical protein
MLNEINALRETGPAGRNSSAMEKVKPLAFLNGRYMWTFAEMRFGSFAENERSWTG